MTQIPSLNYCTKQSFMRPLIRANIPVAVRMQKWREFVAQSEQKEKIPFPMYAPYWAP